MSVVGPWECRLAGAGEWRVVPVPGSWEQAGIPMDRSGPVEYRATLRPPADAAGRRLRLRFGAVSYACEVLVDGREAGRHVGMWDAFEVDVTGLVEPGRPAELLVRVEKPASLTGGPDSAPVPGRYPARETLAGFLPYVWGHSHGGVWQPVELLVSGDCAVRDVAVSGDVGPGTEAGRLSVAATLLGPGEVTVEVHDPDGRLVDRQQRTGDAEVAFELTVPEPRAWSPHDPARYAVTLRTCDGDERTVLAGLRRLTADGALLRLNGEPLYPRMILSWGWYPDRLHPDPGPERVRADLVELRRLGFNGVKLCLWFPPEYYFELADELGMLLWVELPMWLPHPTAHFRGQLFTEAERLVRAAANHPSVILVTLGCELSAAVGADVLGPLYDLVKRLAPGVLVRDNSGSGEAYGGLLDEYADFDDHHFYCEPAYFRATLEHFAPRWRQPRPWLFGEFCDLDTFRDLRRLDTSPDTGRPWWVSADPAVNPQGARWQYDVPAQEETLRRNGLWDAGAELERISARQAVLHRKVTLEAVRTRTDTSGYVVTGERDTPISTAGVWDDLGRLKVDPEEFAQFNGDLVLALDWDRRRAWVAGGDRPAPFDTWCHPVGARVRAHVVLAHHGRTGGPARARWHVGFPDADPFATGRLDADAPRGTVSGLGVAEFVAPAVDRPRRAVLRVDVDCAGETTSNAWPFWVLPGDGWADAGPVAVIDPAGRLPDLAKVAPRVVPLDTPGAVLLATAWTAAARRHVAAGGGAVLLVDAATADPPLPVAAMPFWREAVKVVEPHEAWGDFPHDGWTDLQFAGMAPDLALADADRHAGARPLLRRVDARTSAVHDYAVELPYGSGRLIVTTLRFDGSAGDQPLGLRRNTGAAYLLGQWVGALTGPAARPDSAVGDRAVPDAVAGPAEPAVHPAPEGGWGH
ncbi:glycoside hydrolase [Micromonospora humi]|uniref:Glycosyl hydrolases family 2, sugar binding domain n=1 Tax=Micromonospora humi TaxID=745366 RepID=A0A1C5JE36_9ACTN|nr:glycoside hydrolase [Micromonospora humi]SCG68561.1 Glycosyl hydrolases family 2, sugar binding domain [Micromonospora humi]